MHTVPELIDAFGGSAAFSRAIRVKPSTASEMKRSRSIHFRHWENVVEAARALGLDGITVESLMRMHARDAEAAE